LSLKSDPIVVVPSSVVEVPPIPVALENITFDVVEDTCTAIRVVLVGDVGVDRKLL